MALAIFYNLEDLTALRDTLQGLVNQVSGADRTYVNRVLTAIGTPSAAPVAPLQYQQGDSDTRIIVLSFSGATKISWLDQLAKFIAANLSGREWLRAIWKDSRTSAVEPWP